MRHVSVVGDTLASGIEPSKGRPDVSVSQESGAGIRPMNSVLSTLRVLEEVAVRQPIGVSELARVTRIPKSSVQRCLLTLQQAGWLRVVDADHARWGLTMKPLSIGLRGAGEQDLRVLAGPVVKRLATETDETVFVGLYDGTDFVIVIREDTTQILRASLDVGTRLPLRATSAGVAIMAHLEAAEVDQLLQRDIKEFDGSNLPGPDEMRQEIDRTKKRGYARNMSSWYHPHVASIGVAITNAAGRPVAALTLSVPAVRYERSQEKEFARLTMAAADEISKLTSSA